MNHLLKPKNKRIFLREFPEYRNKKIYQVGFCKNPNLDFQIRVKPNDRKSVEIWDSNWFSNPILKVNKDKKK